MIFVLWATRVERFEPSFTEFSNFELIILAFENLGPSIILRSIYGRASTQENLSSGFCRQQRRRPACPSAQTDQHLCYSLFGKYHIWTCYRWNFNIVASFWSWGDFVEYRSVRNPDVLRPIYDQFYSFWCQELGIIFLCTYQGRHIIMSLKIKK